MEDLEVLRNFDSDDDGEFISTFFNVVQHIHDEESSNVAHTTAVVNRDCQAAHELLVNEVFHQEYLRKTNSS